MSHVKRIFVEKKPGLDIAAQSLFRDLRDNLDIKGITAVRLLNRYDIEGISAGEYAAVRDIVFAEPPVDTLYEETLSLWPAEAMFAVEYLPGQYDQRADSAAQCIQIVTQGSAPVVASASVVVLEGSVSPEDLARIKKYCINHVDSREAALDKPETLAMELDAPPNVAIMSGFRLRTRDELEALRADLGLAMRFEDLAFCQTYFRDTEKRDPTLTEIRVLDTYWSDHCRHTTFLTNINRIDIDPSPFTQPIAGALDGYRAAREKVYPANTARPAKPVCLMDIATIGMKELKLAGLLDNLDSSEEINACSIEVIANIDGREEPWLVMFKNETHNHPTEIEPFGGAATCLGGAIRDPLSGRSYVYHAMRVTGAGDPRRSVAETLPGKLPQRKITTLAAQGYSSYGNQIGLATGQVSEVYDEGFVAKRMEVGAVVGAVPKVQVRREAPLPGDIILLVGGRTGRDGCGGATGSSKEHTRESIHTCGAEVQKGNAPTERKIQRLFRRAEVARLIKRCNDFGAGGVSVAIGELAAGLDIDLDAVPKKYEGLDGTEIAISESQERMAIVVDPVDLPAFEAAVAEENLEMAVVAAVTASRRLRMRWRNATIVDISRDFIDTNGVAQESDVRIAAPDPEGNFFAAPLGAIAKAPTLRDAWIAMLGDLNVCSQKGLGERFDGTIGAASVLLPFGGKFQSTPAQSMVAKLPLIKGETSTGTAMSWGFFPRLASWSPFHGAVYAIVEAVARIVATGGDYRTVRLTLQEYFEKLGTDPVRWGKPFAALLGALYAQESLGIPAIGGKDSMSGTFHDISVPPTLVAFALTAVDVRTVISPEFKQAGHTVVLLPFARDAAEMPDFAAANALFSAVHCAIQKGVIVAAHTVGVGGIAESVSKMCLGNGFGFTFADNFDAATLFSPAVGSIVAELGGNIDPDKYFGIPCVTLGSTTADPTIVIGSTKLTLAEVRQAWEKPLAAVFPPATATVPLAFDGSHCSERGRKRPAVKVAAPRVLITVFPGTNCEYDSARAFERAGAKATTLVIRNRTASDIGSSIDEAAKLLANSQILMIPGGFSAGDEPDGSGKFIAAFFCNPRLKEAVAALLDKRDGLALGICNGFQAIIKLGLVPWGEIRTPLPESPTLTFNTIGRHISRMAHTKIVSVKSPWFLLGDVGDVHSIPISHGEGRFVAPEACIRNLFANGQVATRYVDAEGRYADTMDGNPNGSHAAIEGITSPDGRVLGKMAHSERRGENVLKNVPGVKDQLLFESGVEYFK
jgi:phosphoribosylformylglycinamidine synthase